LPSRRAIEKSSATGHASQRATGTTESPGENQGPANIAPLDPARFHQGKQQAQKDPAAGKKNIPAAVSTSFQAAWITRPPWPSI